MSREIKFRVWNEKSKVMKLWRNLLHQYNTLTCLSYDFFKAMQYTGFKDKNNKEIYEGDIVEAHGFMRAEIVFENGCFKFRWLDKKTKSIRYKIETMFDNTSLIFEVIGNKYENPELLVGDK